MNQIIAMRDLWEMIGQGIMDKWYLWLAFLIILVLWFFSKIRK